MDQSRQQFLREIMNHTNSWWINYNNLVGKPGYEHREEWVDYNDRFDGRIIPDRINSVSNDSDYESFTLGTMSREEYDTIIKETTTCWGCIEDQPNQLAHTDPGGCLYNSTEDTEDTDEEYVNVQKNWGEQGWSDTSSDTSDDENVKYSFCGKCLFGISLCSPTQGIRKGTMIESYTGIKYICSKCRLGDQKWDKMIDLMKSKILPHRVCIECQYTDISGLGNSENWVCEKCY